IAYSRWSESVPCDRGSDEVADDRPAAEEKSLNRSRVLEPASERLPAVPEGSCTAGVFNGFFTSNGVTKPVMYLNNDDYVEDCPTPKEVNLVEICHRLRKGFDYEFGLK